MLSLLCLFFLSISIFHCLVKKIIGKKFIGKDPDAGRLKVGEEGEDRG